MKENAKKVGSIILTIYITVVTLACALFGFLYFSSLSKPHSGLTISSAHDLVQRVCYDMGWIEEENAGMSASSIPSTDFNKNTVGWDDMVDSNGSHFSPTNLKQYLFIAKNLLSKDAKGDDKYAANTFYKSNVMFSSDFKQDYYVNFKLDGNTLWADLIVFTSSGNSEPYNANHQILQLIETSNKGYDLKVCMFAAEKDIPYEHAYVANNNMDGAMTFEANADENGLYHLAFYSVTINDAQNFNAANIDSNFQILDVNAKTGKKIDIVEKTQLSESDLLAEAKRIVNEKNSYKNKSVSFTNATLKASTFATDAFKEIGMI